MTNQIFKTFVPINILYDFIEKIYVFNTESHFVINTSSFKKATFLNIIENFCENIKPFYHISKQYYVTRELSYNKLMTIIRQICKINNIPIISQIKYDKSKYSIQYYVYFN